MVDAHLSVFADTVAAQAADRRVPLPAAARARVVRMSLGRLAHRALTGAGARRFLRLKAVSLGPRLTAARFTN